MSNMRQSSMRNQRSKGFKAKNILQLCVLAVICIWLLYQLKHSYDKKRAVEERIAKMPDRVQTHTDVFKLGRKDLPGAGEMRSGVGVQIRNKEDENEDDQEVKHDTEFGEKNSVLDDEFLEEPERREEADDEGNDALIDEIDSVDEEDREGGVREAREEHYRKDDASSAVHHDSQMTESELGNGGARSSDEVKMANGTVSDTDVKISTTGANDNLTKNVTSSENKVTEPEVPKLENGSLSNSTIVSTASIGSQNQMDLQTNTSTALNNQIETQKNSTELDTVVTSVSLQNETIKLNSVQDRNSTANVGTSGEDKPNMVPVEIKLTEKSNTSETENADQGGSGESSQMERSSTTENNVVAQGESNNPLQMEKSNASEEEDAARGELDDPTHNTVTAQEREARVDLSTLPDIAIKATNTDYEAAE